MKYKVFFAIVPTVLGLFGLILSLRNYDKRRGVTVNPSFLTVVSSAFVEDDFVVVASESSDIESVELKNSRWAPSGRASNFRLPSRILMSGGLNAYSPLNKEEGVAATADGTYIIRKGRSNSVFETLESKNRCYAVATEPRSGLVFGGFFPTVWKWDGRTKKQLWKKRIPSFNPSAAAAFSADGTLLAVGSYNGTVTMFEAATGKKLWASPKITPLSTQGLSYFPSDPLGGYSTLASDGQPGLEKFYFPLCFIPHSDHLLYSDNAATFVCQAKTGKIIYKLPAKQILSTAASPNGKVLALAIAGTVKASGVKLYDASTGRFQQSLPDSLSIHSLSFSPNGKQLAGATEVTIRIWDIG